MPCIDFELQDVQTIHIMRNHLHLWQRIHIVANLSTDSFAHMLYIIKTSGYTSLSMPKKRDPPKPLAKALTLFNQLLGFFSSSINLKSYVVHSAIRVFKSIVMMTTILSISKNTSIHKCKITTNYPKNSIKVFVSYSSKHHWYTFNSK